MMSLDGDTRGMAMAFGAPEWSSGERSEPERNGGAPKARGGGSGMAVPDPEVSARPKRRQFTAAYKARIVEEASRCSNPGEIGALLRREGLYSSTLSGWRELSRRGMLKELADDKRGRKPTKNPLSDEVARLERENRRLQRRLEQAETIIEIQKKVSSMLGIALPSETGESD
jgi:transposase